MRCEQLDTVIEAVADGSYQLSADEQAHVDVCATCRARLDEARDIERLLQTRAQPVTPASFTSAVMLRIGQERWRAERAIDAGFNLAILAGSLVILAGGAGLAWSLGLLTINVDIGALLRALDNSGGVTSRVLSQVQTVALAATLLTTTLIVWWWAEAATD